MPRERRRGHSLQPFLGSDGRQFCLRLDGRGERFGLFGHHPAALVGLPGRDRFFLDLVERLDRGRDDPVRAQHEYRAVGGLGDPARLPFVRRKGELDDVVGRGWERHRLVIDIVTAGIRRGHRGRLQPEFCCRILDRGSTRQGVVDLVRDLVDAIDCCLMREVGLELRLGLFKGLRRRRLDLDGPQDVPAERGLYRFARLVQRQLENGVGKRARHLFSFQQTEIYRFRVLSGDCGGDLLPILAGGKRRFGFLRLFLRRSEDLLDFAALGKLQLVLALLVLLLQLRLGNLDVLGNVRWGEARQREAPIFGGAEQILMRLVERFELGLARLSHIADSGDRQRDDVGDPLLVLVSVEQVDHRLRRYGPGRHRVQQVVAGDIVTQQRHILLLREAVCGEERVEQTTIKAPVSPPEIRVGGDHIADQIVRDVELQPRHFLIDQAPVDQLTEGLVDQAQLLGLL